MNYLPLMRAVVECAAFFELSSDDVVQADAAVSQLEVIASCLQELTPAEKEEFLSYIRQLAEKEEFQAGATGRTEFLRNLGENLGL